MKRFLVLITIAGCSPTSQVGAETDAAVDPGADAATVHNTCNGTADTFMFSGPITPFEAYDFGLVTSAGKVIGMAGSAFNTDVLSFNTKVFKELDTVGDHDVATENIMALRAPFNYSCETGNTMCHGFFANAGTYTVHALHPRYQATFTLSDLYERSDNSGPPGPAIAGTITGCVDKANP